MRGRMTAAAIMAAAACAVTSCAVPRAVPRSGPAAAAVPSAPLATSLTTAGGSWAVVPVASDPVFWQVLARPDGSADWTLDTPPGAASNGGLVAAPEAAADGGLTVAVRPSQDLEFTPLAATTAGGTAWTVSPPLRAGIADAPDTLAVAGRVLAAVAGHGAVEASADGGTTWRTLPAPARRACGAVTVTSVSLDGGTGLLAGGACGPDGTAVLLTRSLAVPSAGWRTVPLPASGRLLRLAGGRALLQSPAGLVLVRHTRGTEWTASAAPLPGTGTPVSSGWLGSSGAWALLPDGTAAVTTGPRAPWRRLPRAPARTSVLASGPGGAIDALAVSGPALTVWRLAPSARRWTRAQSVRVPVQYGSSG